MKSDLYLSHTQFKLPCQFMEDIQFTLYCLFSYTLSSALRFALTRAYATENRPQADVLEVNQSPKKNGKDTIIAATIIDSSVSSYVPICEKTVHKNDLHLSLRIATQNQ